ncbi:DEAD/DEAH box helicase [Donghicola mangrovi]|uniref:DEAD/DEAH box helicase n=1 Tax=Donghicola mangrovi TaxID=2729614 RepID=A0A850QGF2_9RHOB|nr:DEAD/DEAH box helicase [Donghicola mangrovi]
MKKTLAQALERRGYSTLTPVQEAVTNPELGTQDMLVSAQTGSGKTVGFGLAIANAILGEEDVFGPAEAPVALIIAPTRELALQVKRELMWLYEDAGAYLASCVGGMDFRDEKRALARGAHIVVATPGRLRDHIQRESIDLSNVRAVVLDEADEMLDLGFSEDLEFILGTCPEDRQTLLFSATVPREIEKLAQNYQRDALRISTASEQKQHSDIDYRAMVVHDRDAENAIINTLRFYEAPNSIIFANTRAMVARMTSRLSNRGFSVVALSGELTQTERTHALQAMRDGRARVCVATDVAARGIDLPNLELVVHAELPNNHETLLHRSGRTGRAGRKGVSALIVTPKSRKKAERLLKFAKLTADWGNAPSAEEVSTRDQERMLADEAWFDPISESEKATVDLLTQSFNAEQLAAAYLRLMAKGRSAPEEINELSVDAPKPRAPREEFGESAWLRMDAGHDQNVGPRWLLPMICRAGDITKDEIGAIRIMDKETFVQLKADALEGFVEAIGPAMTTDQGHVLQVLDEAPDLPKTAPRPMGKPGGRFGDKGGRFGDKGGRFGDKGGRFGDRGDRGDRPQRADRGDRPERGERPARPEWKERAERPARPDAPRPARAEGAARPERVERMERPDLSEPHGAVVRKAKPVWGDKAKSDNWEDRPRKPRADKPAGAGERPAKSFGAKSHSGKPAPRKHEGDWERKSDGKPAGKRPFNKDGKPGFGRDGGKPAFGKEGKPGFGRDGGGFKGGKPGEKRGFGGKPGGRPAPKGGDATPFRKPAGGKPGAPRPKRP